MTEMVTALGTTTERRTLLRGLIGYRALLSTLGYTTGLQFINGTFAENVEAREGRPPNDIDVFSFLVRPAHYQNDPSRWIANGWNEWISEIANPPFNKTRYGLDTYAIAIDQHNALSLIKETIYWYSLFSHKRVTHDWKGFVRIALNPVDDAAALLIL